MSAVRGNLVGGKLIEEGGAGLEDDLNPSDTSDLVAKIPQFDAKQTERAVAAAADAFSGWRSTSAVTRGEILLRAAGLLRAQADEVAGWLRREAGKPKRDALGEVAASAQFLEYYGGLGRTAYGDVLPDARAGVFSHTRYEPLGPVAAITPWNDPLLTPARKLGPALITGNTVVLKPAPDTPVVAQELARILSEAGLPDGVLNIVTGPTDVVGPVLTTHPLVQAVTFTGSTAVGKTLRVALASRGVRLQTEMGGKNAVVVLPDADPELVGATIVGAAFGGVGQRCTATSRVIMVGQARERALEAIYQAMDAQLVVGPTESEQTTFGPVISARQMKRVLGYIEQAKDEGGRIVRGGSQATGGDLDRGYFIEPTVIEVEPSATLWREEAFGPVVAVATADTVDDAIRLVNDSSYGLSAAIYTRDLNAAFAFADAVDTGQVAVNLPTSGWAVQLPFGGFKDSGSLFKEQGTAALDFYRKLKTVAMKVA